MQIEKGRAFQAEASAKAEVNLMIIPRPQKRKLRH